MGVEADKLAIRELVENWVVWRDAGDWDRFKTVWHDDGVMMATWFQGPADEFIARQPGRVRTRRADPAFPRRHDRRRRGGTRDCPNEDDDHAARARARRRMRRTVHRPLLRLSRGTGRAVGIVLRQPIYEQDRIDPVDPAASLELDAALLGRFPVGYRHLAYLQTQAGFTVKPDMPGLTGPEVEALYARGATWLAGGGVGAS